MKNKYCSQRISDVPLRPKKNEYAYLVLVENDGDGFWRQHRVQNKRREMRAIFISSIIPPTLSFCVPF